MRQAVSSLMILVLILAGCQDQHQKNKAAAMNRWNAARSQITTNMAREQFQSGNFAMAAQTAQGVLGNNPQYLPARLLLGQVYLEQEQYAKARKCFAECLEQEPGHPQANYYLGTVHEKWNELDQAFACYEKAWQGQRDHAPYLLAMVETKVSQGEHETALSLLLEGMKETDREPSLFMAAGTIYSHLGQYDQAMGMYQRILDSSPGDRAVTEAMAFCLYKAGRYSEAKDLFGKLINSSKTTPPWSYDLAMGDCCMNLNQYHEAIRCFERVSQQDGSNPKIWVRLAQASLGRKDYNRARTYVDRALALHGADAEAWTAQGIIAMQEQDYPKAQEAFQAAVRADERSSQAYCWLGQSLEAQGNAEEARSCYARALERDPGDALARKFLQLIEGQTQSSSPRAEKF